MKLKIFVAAAGVVMLAACGSSSKNSTTGTTTGGSSGTSAYGSPGAASAADRTIDVSILSSLRYNPSAITVSPGETVTFKVTNQTTGIHEFVLGNSAVQDSYERTMQSMGPSPMTMPDHSNLVNEQAGVTKELTWHFPTTLGATVIFGSHEPGDYTHGLRGTITVGTVAAGSSTTDNMSQMPGMTSTTDNMSQMPGMTSTTDNMSQMPGMTSTTTGGGM